ncbi:glycosyltransferase PgfM2 [Streptococcus macacae]|uniref:Bacterial membrane protein YfhO n=1 Tax=Streptococcus macacae NCTC 11558 TaxID=764298 RepID=G5JWX5_9STRE|nr:YfhO family protein [Streptococcus macacae]EHJ53354.1 bacterial membrane protein YfhO [Streptococcus macacae NCTC 11558]SUN79451.1 transmembrane protein [Streptococcus macacae NCTC 11558]
METQETGKQAIGQFSRVNRKRLGGQAEKKALQDDDKQPVKSRLKDTLGFLAAFSFPILVMIAVFAVLRLYPFGKNTLMSGDYTLQYVPLYRALGQAFKHLDFGALFWSWHKGLGGVMPSVWGFNSLSPFSLALGLTPAAYLNIAIFSLSLLRQGFAGLTFYYFLHKRYQASQNRILAVCIASIYGLSGFLIANQMNPNFLDNMIFLPLLMVGIEKILDGKVSIKYSLVLAAMFIVQFYTAYMACLFIVLYSCYYLLIKEAAFSFKVKQLLRLFLYSLLGVGLSAIWLLPVFYALLDTKAASGDHFPWSFSFLYNPLRLLIKFVPGAASGQEWGDFNTLPNFYAGVLSFIGLFNYFFTKTITARKKIGSFLFLAVLILAFSNAAVTRFWHMGQMPVGFYYRNAWLLSAVLLLLTYQAFQKVKSWHYTQLICTFAFALLANAYVYFAVKEKSYLLVTAGQQFIMLSAVLVLLLLISKGLSKKWQLTLALFITLIDMGVNAKFTIERDLWHSPAAVLDAEKNNEAFYKQLKLSQSDLSRLEKSSGNTWNDSLTYNYYGVNHFTSSVEYGNLEFLGRLGLPSSTAISMYVGGTPLTDALVNLRYYVTNGTWSYTARKDLLKYYKPVQTVKNGQLLENNQVLGLGFSGDAAMLKERLTKQDPAANQNKIYHGLTDSLENVLEPDKQAAVSLENVTVDSTNGKQVYKRQSSDRPGIIRYQFTPDDNSYYLSASHIMPTDLSRLKLSLNGEKYTVFDRYRHPQLWSLASNSKSQKQTFELTLSDDKPLDLTGLQIYRFNDERFQEFMKNGKIAKWHPSRVTSLSVSGQINQVQGKDYLLTSIPYNKGWHVRVDGKSVKTQKVWQSMLAFKLTSGKHRIDLYYIPQGFVYGSLLSFFSLLLLISITIKHRRHAKLEDDEDDFEWD